MTEPDEEAPHILVVDDDPRLRQLLHRYLVQNGYFATTAADAIEAKSKVKNMAFDLIVLDIMMPGQDGLSLTGELRTESDVPILLLTARGAPEDRIRGLEAGADDYLAKPFEPRELLLRDRDHPAPRPGRAHRRRRSASARSPSTGTRPSCAARTTSST